MKHPLQALLIAPDEQMWTNVLLETKSITLREGHRDYHRHPNRRNRPG
jgi:hypothetical protein